MGCRQPDRMISSAISAGPDMHKGMGKMGLESWSIIYSRHHYDMPRLVPGPMSILQSRMAYLLLVKTRLYQANISSSGIVVYTRQSGRSEHGILTLNRGIMCAKPLGADPRIM